jgi:hypothetical protein
LQQILEYQMKIPHEGVVRAHLDGKEIQHSAPACPGWVDYVPGQDYNPLNCPHWDWRIKPEDVPLYNHMFTIAFTVISEREGADVTDGELIDGLNQRILDITINKEVQEACQPAIDTCIMEPK